MFSRLSKEDKALLAAAALVLAILTALTFIVSTLTDWARERHLAAMEAQKEVAMQPTTATVTAARIEAGKAITATVTFETSIIGKFWYPGTKLDVNHCADQEDGLKLILIASHPDPRNFPMSDEALASYVREAVIRMWRRVHTEGGSPFCKYSPVLNIEVEVSDV
jgi:hypothetical protein